MKELYQKIQRYNYKINQIVSMQFEGFISFMTLMSFRLNDTLEIGASENKVISKGEFIMWHTIIPPDKDIDTPSFQQHYHNCIETIDIISGELTNAVNNEKKGPGGQMKFIHGEIHHPINLGEENVVCNVKHYRG